MPKGNRTRRKTKAQSKVAKERPAQYAADRKKKRDSSGKPTNLELRAERNRARNAKIKAGKAKKGDGKDVGHKKPLSKGGAKKDSNTKVQSRKSNRAAGGRMSKGKQSSKKK